MLSNLKKDRFLERELSWLAFNERVLELAEDKDLPLLERVKFLSIFASNLDEFFMVRVAGLKRRIATGIALPSSSGEAPKVVLDSIRRKSYELQKRHTAAFYQNINFKLVKEGIKIFSWDDCSQTTKKKLKNYFINKLFPILTPLAVDPAHPFPYISGLSLNFAIMLQNPETNITCFARLKVPTSIERLIHLDKVLQPTEKNPQHFIAVEQVIEHNLELLFPGMKILESHLFRITRNEDVSVEEDDAENLLKAIEKELLRRKFGPPVRLEVLENISDYMLQYLVQELDIEEAEVFKLKPPLDFSFMQEISAIQRPDLHYIVQLPQTNRSLKEAETSQAADIFTAMRKHDVLLHHPYDAFQTSVQAFVEQASSDPKVQAIKQTLYRTSGDSPIVSALIEAAQLGKQVLAIIEIKARFDEEANIIWARKLEEAGVHVVYGIVGLKTHCKLSLVVRKEKDSLVRYAHIGTGNYHPKTARSYEDLGLLTCDPLITEDISRLFNQLSGYAPKTNFNHLLVAPRTLRSGLEELINNEIQYAQSGKMAKIQIKVNSIVDEKIIDSLYQASQKGVKIEIIVRGTCSLRPGVNNLSENITIRSILGRYLEHSRMFIFNNCGNDIIYIGSSDMMHRNLDRRVEVLVRINNVKQKNYIKRIFNLYMSKNIAHWELYSSGKWVRYYKKENEALLLDAQNYLSENRNVILNHERQNQI